MTTAFRFRLPSAPLRVSGVPVFQGRYEHSIDEKGRLAIPAPFRKRLLGEAPEGDATVMVTYSDQCLAAFPLAEWEEKLKMLSKLTDPTARAFKRIFVGCAHECPIDKAGRILLPVELRRDAKLEKDCVIIGQLEKFEIWSAERWNGTFNQLSDQLGHMYAALAESGIQI